MNKFLLALLLAATQANAALNVDLSAVDPGSTHSARFASWATPALSGSAPYGFRAAHAVTLSRLTNNTAWCALAMTMTEQHVAKAESDIAAGNYAYISFDSYLYAGEIIESLAATYQYCPQVTAEQKVRWGAYAEQAVWNIWNFSQASWGGKSFPWSGWGTNNPGNNYHYSFLRATMTWGFAKPAGGTDWIAWLRTNKIPQIIAYYTANGAGGGSREGTGYGMAHAALYSVYKIWKDNTPENQDLANATVHLRDSIDYLIHATMPDLKKFAPIGDLARVSYPALYDYHRCYMIEARKQAPAVQASRATWWLNRITPTRMQDGFNFECGLFDGGGTESAPTALYHYSPGAGHLFARDSWASDALWIGMVAGRYDESHAAQDQGSFTVFHKDFLAVTENIFSRSGINQHTETQNVIRFEKAGATIPQRILRETTMTVTPGTNGTITAEANLTPFYTATDGVQWSRKLTTANKTVEIQDTLTLASGTTAIWQLNTPVQPVKVTDNSYRAGSLLITVLAPATPQISVVDWKTVDATEFPSGYKLEVRGGTTEYRVLLAATDTVVVPPVEPPPEVEPPVVIPPPAPFVYPGYVMKSTGTCLQGMTWHYQCGRLWVQGSTLLPTDLVATCLVINVDNTCSNSGNPPRRYWKQVSNLTRTDQVLSCSAIPADPTGRDNCTSPRVLTYVTQDYVPPPAQSGMFVLDNSRIDRFPQVYFHFWAGMPDVNGDGCLDMFVGGHDDNTPAHMAIQQRTTAGTCAGNFLFNPPNGNITQALPAFPRISSRWTWANLFSHPDGLWSFMGQDVDVGTSAAYRIIEVKDGKPVYAAKQMACFDRSCIPADIDNDGVLERVNSFSIRNQAGDIVCTRDFAGRNYGNMAAVFDTNNDGYLDILHPSALGNWAYNPATKCFDWKANTFPANTIDPLAGAGHFVPFDYDNDGDLDVYIGQGHYSPVGADTVVAVHGPNTFIPHLYRNDNGIFTDVTAQAKLDAPGLLKNDYYFTIYGLTSAADIENDGDVDLVFGSEQRVDSNDNNASQVALIINNGDGTFKVDRSVEFGPFTSEANSAGRPWTNIGDYNNDGRIDIVKTHTVSSIGESIGLFRNNISNSNHWLRIRVQGVTTDGFGTRIVIKRAGTDTVIGSQQIGVFHSGLANLIPHFGLGSNTLVDIEIYRPHGKPVITFKDQTVDRDIVISKGMQLRTYIPGSPLIVADTAPPVEPPDEPPPPPPLSELEKAQAEIAALKVAIEQLQADKAALTNSNDQQAATISGLNDQLTAVNVNLIAAQEGLVRAEQSLTAEKAKLSTLTSDMRALADQYGE